MVAQLQYPPPLEDARGAASILSEDEAPIDLETPVLIVGGGPVGMLQALILARLHKKSCTLIERELSTTIWPKMEYTNGRSMEIYRALGLHDDLRKAGTALVPEQCANNEIIVTSLVEGGKLIDVWEHDSVADMRKKSREHNDGSQYLEPHMRCHQIVIEKWLKEKVKAEPMIQSFWGTAFLGLLETKESVITQVRNSTGQELRIKSRYLIGTDGGGSWVRKSAGLESKREFLNLTASFVHFRSANLRQHMPFPPAWHANAIGGGVLVSQNEDDVFTAHFIVPPTIDAATLTPDQILGLTLGGCQGPVKVPYDEIYCGGTWKCEVAVANSFHSAQQRVFLAGDAAHQLSPIGGHGLNSGIGDIFDLGWKLAATLDGWAGKDLLLSYNAERRSIAFENLDHVQEGLTTVIMPIFGANMKFGADVVNSDSADGETARKEIQGHCERGKWLHDQNGNILGVTYKQSPITFEADGPKSTTTRYIPTTAPGSRAPHVYMNDGSSTLDHLNYRCFNIVNFSSGSEVFVQAAKELGIPLQVVDWNGEEHVRGIYEKNLILIRPDGYAAWRGDVPSKDEAIKILQRASGGAA